MSIKIGLTAVLMICNACDDNEPEKKRSWHAFAKMGSLYTKEKKYPEAEVKFKDGLKLWQNIPKLSSIARRNMKECLQAYGDLLDAQGHPDKAKEMHDRASATVTH